ncbi:MAG: VWA domain-containing protein, partial [Verrucomicrobiota bacterium]
MQRLNKGDRFNVVRFSTDVETFQDSLVKANKGNKEEALKFVEDLVARGGTDINGALEAAMEMDHKEDRPYIIVFLTDGKPTIGETDTNEIVANLDKCGKNGTRVFVFGVGEKVNTHLLDQISGNHGGLSRYVKPEEDIEVKVSSFVDKISHPVLANLELDVDEIKLTKMHPQKLPDLFGGQQLTVFGRYKGNGHVAIKLKGEVNGTKKEYVYETTFPEKDPGHDFIARLWGTRRVGYLLDQIRLHGESRELKDEVIQLSKDYGIMTPYTSYLVLEDDSAYKNHNIPRTRANVARTPMPENASGRHGGLDFSRADVRKAPEPAAPVAEPGVVADGFVSGFSRETVVLKDAADPFDVDGDDINHSTFAYSDAVDLDPGREWSKRESKQSLGQAEVRRGAESRKYFRTAPGKKGNSSVASSGVAPRRKMMIPVFGNNELPAASKPAGNLRVESEEERQKKARDMLALTSGEKAIQISEAIADYQSKEVAGRVSAAVRHIGSRYFYNLDGVWTDSAFKKTMKITKVKFAGDAYFKLLKDKPELK